MLELSLAHVFFAALHDVGFDAMNRAGQNVAPPCY
jgi:hypothetical protein